MRGSRDAALLLMTAGLLAGPVSAQEPTQADSAADAEASAAEAPAEPETPAVSTDASGADELWGAPAGRPSIGLDRLLNLPGGTPTGSVPTQPGGRDRQDWQRRFAEARAEVRELRESVDRTQEKMREASGASYSYSPSGASETYDPEVLKLRAQLQRDRQSLETAERRLRDLEVEASLAGVPPAWQAPPGTEAR